MLEQHYLTTLFEPKSVAVIGASDRENAVGAVIFKNILSSGYKGRLGVHELLPGDDALQRLMARSPSRDELTAFCKSSGHATLFDDGLQRVLDGRTTLEEVARAVQAV